jgi:hypothetical protein
LHDHREHLRRAARRLGEPLAQRLALDEFHRQEDLLAVRAHVVHGDDVGVRQASERLGLAQEASAADRVAAEARSQELERELAIELGVVGGVHHPHAARAEPREDHVAPDDLAGIQPGGAAVGLLRPVRIGRKPELGRHLGGASGLGRHHRGEGTRRR